MSELADLTEMQMMWLSMEPYSGMTFVMILRANLVSETQLLNEDEELAFRQRFLERLGWVQVDGMKFGSVEHAPKRGQEFWAHPDAAAAQ